jgi:glycosyltransferase involved in cell wall biosynthesis
VTRRPRILRVITRLNVGGPSTHVTVADRGLQAAGWDTLLAYGSVDADESEIDVAALGVPAVRVAGLGRAIRPAADARAAVGIARLIRRHRPDVIHTHLSKAGLITRAVAMATSRAVRVHTFHGTIFGGYFGTGASAAIVRAERFLGARTDAVVALSQRQRDELLDEHIAPDERIRIVPLGLPIERFAAVRTPEARMDARTRLGIPLDAFAIVAVGRLVEIKRLDRLIDAVAIVARSGPGVHLYLVGGGGSRSDLERRAADQGVQDRVTFAGWSADTPDWYAAADVIALSSEREGTPLALIEAAAAARPVVATDVGGVADVVADGETGFLVPPDDVAALADRLLQLWRDPALRERMGAAAPARAAGYSADRLVGDLDGLYRELLADRRRRREP